MSSSQWTWSPTTFPDHVVYISDLTTAKHFPRPPYSPIILTIVLRTTYQTHLSPSFPSFETFYWSVVDLQCCVSFGCTAK